MVCLYSLCPRQGHPRCPGRLLREGFLPGAGKVQVHQQFSVPVRTRGAALRLPQPLTVQEMAMYAVIRAGGKQYRVAPGDVIEIEKLAKSNGDNVQFDDVLAVSATEGEIAKP